MRPIFSCFVCLLFSVSLCRAFLHTSGNNPTNNTPAADTTAPALQKTKTSPSAQWDAYWKIFTTAINTKDTAAVALLSSPDFYDGGGSTVQQWLQADVYRSDKTFAAFSSLLKKGTRPFKGYNKTPYRATGNNKPGDLFFEYSKGHWLFGGLVGD